MNRRFFLIILLLGLVLTLGACGYKGIRLYTIADSLRGHQLEAEALLANGITGASPEAVTELTRGVRADVVALRDETALFMPLTRFLGWVPEVGPLMTDAPQLMEMADSGTLAAVHLVEGLAPALGALQGDAPGLPLPQIVGTIERADADLVEAQNALTRTVAARRALENSADYPDPLPALFERVDPYLPLAEEGISLLQVAPRLLGSEEPRTYLIIAQNEDELRPTGGFISGAGLLTVANGDIVELSFEDANVVDDWRNKPYAAPPDPLLEYMGLQLFFFRDANFWPDFPTSAEMSMDLFTYGREVPLDGAIAINQRFVEQVLAITGPVYVPELDQTISRSDVLQNMRAAWSFEEGQNIGEWIETRKAFMGPLAAAIRTRLESDLGSIDPILMVDTIQSAVAARNLQIYVRDPAVAGALRDLGWDGHLANEPGLDVFMIAETNVGYKKSNPRVTRTLDYAVRLDAGGGVATATVRYENSSPPAEGPCDQATSYAGGLNYEALVENCYWNYLRVYAPAGSQLQSATPHTAPATAFLSGAAWSGQAAPIGDPTGLTVFETFLLVPRAAELETELSYRLPPTVLTQLPDGSYRYELRLYKQSGVHELPATVEIEVPTGAAIRTATVSGHDELLQIADESVRFTGTLRGDVTLIVEYDLQ